MQGLWRNYALTHANGINIPASLFYCNGGVETELASDSLPAVKRKTGITAWIRQAEANLLKRNEKGMRTMQY